jgi:hypothetical protein
MGLSESVQITLTSSTKAVTQKGFGTQLILGPNANFNARAQEFTSAGAALAAALAGGSDSLEYAAAVAAFSQVPSPESIKIGHVRGSKTIVDNGSGYTAGAITGKVNGHTFTAAYNATKSQTLTDLAAAIAAADTADVSSAVYTSGYNTIDVTPKAGKLIAITDLDLSAITGAMLMEVQATALEDYDDALSAIALEDDDFYQVSEVSHILGNQEDVAAWVEANGTKVFGISSAVANIIDTTAGADTTTIATVLKAATRRRSFGLYSAVADTLISEAAALGVAATRSPGRYTMCYKNLAGITVDTLTPTQSANARDKYFNTFETVGPGGIVRWGKVSSGEYFDQIVFEDWLKARLMEEIFGKLINLNKLSFDKDGTGIIEQAMVSVFKEGQTPDAQGIRAITQYSKDANGAQNGGYYILFPNLDDVSANNKANRILPDVFFKVWYTNGIHVVEIGGNILL